MPEPPIKFTRRRAAIRPINVGGRLQTGINSDECDRLLTQAVRSCGMTSRRCHGLNNTGRRSSDISIGGAVTPSSATAKVGWLQSGDIPRCGNRRPGAISEEAIDPAADFRNGSEAVRAIEPRQIVDWPVRGVRLASPFRGRRFSSKLAAVIFQTSH